ncbi:MAG TPA: hypothetical protein VMW86_10350 [Dehalococcoidales bacterium]|nr:hypothetical protein [Dehalococcoidales bacterium]
MADEIEEKTPEVAEGAVEPVKKKRAKTSPEKRTMAKGDDLSKLGGR